MTFRLRRSATAVPAAIGLLVWAFAPARAAQQNVPAMSGVWKLNVEASTNPNGPEPARGGAPARGRSGGGSGTAVDETSGGPTRSAEGGSLGADEQRRFNATKALFFHAPEMMGLEATATDFRLLLDPVKKLGYQHKTDNKKQSITTAGGPADFKVKWDGSKLRREIETPDTLHIVEEYSISPDGKQLIVTDKADSRMVRNVQTGDIRRVYDRQQQ